MEDLLESVKLQRFDADTLSERFEVDSVYLLSGPLGEGGLVVSKKMEYEDSLIIMKGVIDEKHVL